MRKGRWKGISRFIVRRNVRATRRRRGDYCETWVPLWLTAHFLDAAAQFKEKGVDLGR